MLGTQMIEQEWPKVDNLRCAIGEGKLQPVSINVFSLSYSQRSHSFPAFMVAQSKRNYRYLVRSQSHTIMEATFVMKTNEDKAEFAERLTQFFAGKAIRIKVEEVIEPAIDQQHLLRRMEALRLITEQVPVSLPPGIDIDDLIDEINDTPL